MTADEPFLDPGVLNGLVSLHLKTDDGMTFATNNLERTWPLGLDAEVFSFGLLERAHRMARKAEDREHVSGWMRTAPNVERVNLSAPEGMPEWFGSIRWTVDTERDLAFARSVISALGGRLDFTTAEVVGLLERQPGLMEMVREAA